MCCCCIYHFHLFFLLLFDNRHLVCPVLQIIILFTWLKYSGLTSWVQAGFLYIPNVNTSFYTCTEIQKMDLLIHYISFFYFNFVYVTPWSSHIDSAVVMASTNIIKTPSTYVVAYCTSVLHYIVIAIVLFSRASSVIWWSKAEFPACTSTVSAKSFVFLCSVLLIEVIKWPPLLTPSSSTSLKK